MHSGSFVYYFSKTAKITFSSNVILAVFVKYYLNDYVVNAIHIRVFFCSYFVRSGIKGKRFLSTGFGVFSFFFFNLNNPFSFECGVYYPV